MITGQAAFVFEFTSSTEREKSKGPNSPQRLSDVDRNSSHTQTHRFLHREERRNALPRDRGSFHHNLSQKSCLSNRCCNIRPLSHAMSSNFFLTRSTSSLKALREKTASLEHEVQRLDICHAAQCDAVDGCTSWQPLAQGGIQILGTAGTAVVSRLPRNATFRERRKWQKAVDGNRALLQHHHQPMQSAEDKLANLMREVQEKHQFLDKFTDSIWTHREDALTRVKCTVQTICDT